jgi:hypothetical protein
VTLPHADKRKFIFSLSVGERIIAVGNIFMMAAICAAKNPQQIEQALKRQGIIHLIVREDLLSDFVTDNRTPDQAVVWNQSAQCRITLDFSGRGYAVLQLHG